ncbi:uncharacterized protein LOC131854496 [Achroia grisella]|uniref:uncharacterized protein LOC131854496 n=1 Tax=Achroia grisella TaxID=688607 RepID=UPI0027D2C0E4|nr:uncharacterized protein LOC131854496 [Achroia grisella]
MAATAVIENLFRKNDLDLALIQEPWLNKATPLGLNASELCTDDLVTAFVNFPGCTGSKVLVCSAYLPGHDENNKIIKDPTTGLQPVVEYARKHKAELLVGCDANAHHTNWGSSDINTRGCTPTFVTATRQEVLDITLATDKLAEYITHWHVSNENSMSDHKHIRFTIEAATDSNPILYRNPKATDWPKYRDSLTSLIADLPKSIKSPLELELAVDILLSGIISAYQNNCPIKTKTAKCKTPWWNKSLEKLRKKTRKLSNRAKKGPFEWAQYSKAQTEYYCEIRKAKRASWRAFCEEITQTPQGSRVHKMLAKAPNNQIGLMKRPNGEIPRNQDERIPPQFGSLVASEILDTENCYRKQFVSHDLENGK